MKKIIYIDHNVFIDIQNNRKPKVKSLLTNLDDEKYQIVFSPANIEEIAAIKMHHGQNQEKINDALRLLKKITNSTAILPYKIPCLTQNKHIGVYISKEEPSDTYKRVISYYDNNHFAETHQKQKIANGEAFQKATGITPKNTNQIDIQKEIDTFKPKLCSILQNNYMCIPIELNEYLPPEPPTCNNINFEFLGKYFPLHEMTIEKIFEFLEMIRYYPDKSTQFLSGLHDTTHAIYAAYCDIFITNDKKLRQKTKATYDWLGIKTSVFTPDEFIEYFS